ALGCRHPSDLAFRRIRHYLEGWRPGRPHQLRELVDVFDTVGPYSSKRANQAPMVALAGGMVRRGGRLPFGTPHLVRDHDPTPEGPRRRRGFRVRRDVSSELATGENAFAFWRSYDDQLHGVYKVGTKLFYETGDTATQLDTLWNAIQKPVMFTVDNRLIILTGDRRKVWNGGTTIHSFGVAAPPSCTASATGGGTLTGAYYWAVTEYDPTTGDESAPTISGIVNPAGQAVQLTLGAVSSETRFSQRRIYRTTNGGSAPDLFLIDTIATATTYTDTGEVDGTQRVGVVETADGTVLGYITGTEPDTFSMGVAHMERAFYAGGETNGDRIYPSEAGEPLRWYSGGYLTCEGIVRALLSLGHRLVAFTDNTVEIFESDWVRDDTGTYSVVHTVVSRRCGALGPHAVVNVEGAGAFWMDRRGIWRWTGGEPERISDDIEDLFPYVNHGISRRVVASYNHIRRQVGFSVPMADTSFQEDNTRLETWLFCHASRPTQWFTKRLEASFHGAFDDDLNGLQYGCIDHLGVFKQLESYEGDGAQGNESFTTEDAGGAGVGISSIAGSTVTVTGSPGWTANALRGIVVCLRDRSTGQRYHHLVASNTTTALTVVGAPNAALAAGDGWYLGAIDARWESVEHGLDSPNDKILRQVQYEFADLDGGLYL
ncbi:MAG: hypothetical protein IT561_28380, partial [Alphaproteobacteria bacterium]|nr:hypothetical protein [Alphaproteobacteria bacterium]